VQMPMDQDVLKLEEEQEKTQALRMLATRWQVLPPGCKFLLLLGAFSAQVAFLLMIGQGSECFEALEVSEPSPTIREGRWFAWAVRHVRHTYLYDLTGATGRYR
jgi:hypothetical protein